MQDGERERERERERENTREDTYRTLRLVDVSCPAVLVITVRARLDSKVIQWNMLEWKVLAIRKIALFWIPFASFDTCVSHLSKFGTRH